MAMPETAVDEDHGLVFREYHIWLSGKIPGIDPEPETATVQKAANQYLRSGIFAANAGHHAAACFRINDIGHESGEEVAGACLYVPVPSAAGHGEP